MTDDGGPRGHFAHAQGSRLTAGSGQPVYFRMLAWGLVVAGCAVAAVAAARLGVSNRQGPVTIFSAAQRGFPLVIPADAIEPERRAAGMLQATLSRAAALPASAFPIVPEQRGAVRTGILVGATARGGGLYRGHRSRPPFDAGVSCTALDGTVAIRSERRESIESAASWFLEERLGATWFIPGPLGEVVPRRDSLVVPEGETRAQPGFVHRDFGVHGPGAAEWYARNRFESRLEHGHNLANIFRPEDFRRAPDMAPLRRGRKFIPPPNRDSWQPNLLSRAAVEHAAAVANRAFAADPKRLSFSLSTNDTDRYDESAATLAAVSPPRFFRNRPDYSNLVFGFTNAVAEQVARRHPDRWLPAYAYYWCENVPSFPIARNVVPFLTADRSRWSFPEFAAEDRALIEKWCRSGAGMVGVYDYFYGVPFFCPRPTLYAVTETIPFEHRAGVRAFYAEATPNWALDGPKPWLTAQLLWNPQRDPAELLERYYREFWAEAAEPMGRFFDVCETAWKQQPGPPLWLRYFQDEDQAYIYTPEQRAELRRHVDDAARAARTDIVRQRVAFTAAALEITEAFADFCAARERAHRLSRAAPEPLALFRAWQEYREARARFTRLHATLRREQPLAVGPQDLEIYPRNQPDGRIARELLRTEAGRATLREFEYLPEVYLLANERDLAALLARGIEMLRDPTWHEVQPPPPLTSAVVDWTPAGSAWYGEGEPWEGRTIELRPGRDGRKVLRMASCRTEGIGQWTGVTPNALYVASAHVRARSSPGTATYLIVSFLDGEGRHIGNGRVDRLPADREAVQETDLTVIVRAPPAAHYIGFGLRAQNQINDDFAEFSAASLRQLVR